MSEQVQEVQQEQPTVRFVESMGENSGEGRFNNTFDSSFNSFFGIEDETIETKEPKPEETKSEPNTEDVVETTKDVEVKQDIVEETKAQENVTQDPLELLGFADEKDKAYVSKIIEAYKNNQINDFLSKATVDYDKMSDAEILRIKVKNENPDLSEDDINFIIEDTLEKYGITGDEEADAKALKRMSLDLRSVRGGLKKEQEAYIANAYVSQPSKEQLEAQKSQEEFIKSIQSDAYLTEVEGAKVIKFGDLNFEVPEGLSIKEAATNPVILLSEFFDDKGNLNTQQFAKWAVAAKSFDKIVQAAIEHGVTKANKEHVEKLRGIDKSEDVAPASKSKNPQVRFLN